MVLVAGTSLFYLVLNATIWPEKSTTVSVACIVSLVVGSCVTAVVAFRLRTTQRGLVLAGLVFEVLLCLAISVIEFHDDRANSVARLISWTCVAIAFFPILCPAPRRWTVLASMAAALMTPAGWAIASWIAGDWSSSPAALASRMAPPLLSVGMAYSATCLLNQLGTEVTRARRLGAYVLIEKLGQGGMGEVWRARHNLLARPAAIKLIKQDILASKSMADARSLIERFEREAQVIASLESPHTITLYDFGVAESTTLYYVMELLSGVDLETMVATYGPLPPERAIHILGQVCDSLEEAHRAGLIHRDVKPANIHVCNRAGRGDFVKVLDFGLVKRFDLEADNQSSTVAEIKGTPAYVSPEMISGDPVDGRSDIYALGCVAYFMLTGQLPFPADSAIKMLIAHASAPPPPLSLRVPRPIPSELERVVMACLEKDPDRRPQSARELADRLAAVDLAEAWTERRSEAWWAQATPTPAARRIETAPTVEQITQVRGPNRSFN
jgi:serine/threonine-protein kinase